MLPSKQASHPNLPSQHVSWQRPTKEIHKNTWKYCIMGTTGSTKVSAAQHVVQRNQNDVYTKTVCEAKKAASKPLHHDQKRDIVSHEV
jgi:hypothetical protein